MKKSGPALEKSEPWVNSLEWTLQLMAFHLRTLATAGAPGEYPARGGFGLSAGEEYALVGLNYEVRPSDPGPGEWGPWARVTLRRGLEQGKGQIFYEGNRCGAGDAVARAYAPVIADSAGYWAADAARKASKAANAARVAS